jgi:hypothetical protein
MQYEWNPIPIEKHGMAEIGVMQLQLKDYQ